MLPLLHSFCKHASENATKTPVCLNRFQSGKHWFGKDNVYLHVQLDCSCNFCTKLNYHCVIQNAFSKSNKALQINGKATKNVGLEKYLV